MKNPFIEMNFLSKMVGNTVTILSDRMHDLSKSLTRESFKASKIDVTTPSIASQHYIRPKPNL